MKKNYLLRPLTIAFICISLSISGCDNRGLELNTTMVWQIDSVSNHLLSFNDYEKIDGIEVQNGTLRYELNFKGQINAKQNMIWRPVISFKLNEQTKLSIEQPVLSNDSTSKDFLKKDYGYVVTGKGVFEKRDSGWKLISIYMN